MLCFPFLLTDPLTRNIVTTTTQYPPSALPTNTGGPLTAMRATSSSDYDVHVPIISSDGNNASRRSEDGGGIYKVHHSRAEDPSVHRMAEQMDGLSLQVNATPNSHLASSSTFGVTGQLFRDPSTQMQRTAVQTTLPTVIVSDSSSIIPRAFDSSLSPYSLPSATADPSSINQSDRIRPQWRSNEWEDKDKNGNTANQLETFTSSSSAALAAAKEDYPAQYSSKSPAAAAAGGLDLEWRTEKYLPGKSNGATDEEDVNDIIPSSYRFVSLSEQRNSQQMPTPTTAGGEGRTASARIDDNNQNDDYSTQQLQGRHQQEPPTRTELENYAEHPGTAGAGDVAAKTKTTLNYRNTDHYFDDYVARDGSRDKDIPATPLVSNTQQRVHQKWEKIVEVDEKSGGAVDGEEQVHRKATGKASTPQLLSKSSADQFIDTVGGAGKKWSPEGEVNDSQFKDYRDYGRDENGLQPTPGYAIDFNSQGNYSPQELRIEGVNNYDQQGGFNYSPAAQSQQQEELGEDKYYGDTEYQPHYRDDHEKADVGNEKRGFGGQDEDYHRNAGHELGHEYSEQYINQNNYPVTGDEHGTAGAGFEDSMSSFVGNDTHPRYPSEHQQRTTTSRTGSPNKTFAAHEESPRSPMKENYAATPSTSNYYSGASPEADAPGNSNESSPRKAAALRMAQLQEEVEEEAEQQQQHQPRRRPLEMDQSYYTQGEGDSLAAVEEQHYRQPENTPSALVGTATAPTSNNNNSPEDYREEVLAFAAATPTTRLGDAPLNPQQEYLSPPADPILSSLEHESPGTYESQFNYPNTGAVDDYGGNYEESGFVPLADGDQMEMQHHHQQEHVDYGNYLADATPAPVDGGDYQGDYSNDQNYTLDPSSNTPYNYNDQTEAEIGTAYVDEHQAGGGGEEYQDYYHQGKQGNYSTQEIGDGVNYTTADGNYATEQEQGYYLDQQQQQQQVEHQGDYYPDSTYLENQLQDPQQQPDYYSEQLAFNPPEGQHNESSVSFASDNATGQPNAPAAAAAASIETPAAPVPEPKPKKPIKKVQILETSDSSEAAGNKSQHQKGKRTGSVLKGGLKNKRSDASASDSSDFNFNSK